MLFDNFGIEQITGPVLEETHYYPNGLTIAGISTEAPLKLANNYKFNSIELNHKEFGDGSGIELYTATYRSYDPQIGRWQQADPHATGFPDISPYNGMSDNPVSYSDRDGDCPWCFVIAAVVGAGINVAHHWGQITAGGFHWDKFAEAVGIGATAGIVGVATGGAGFAAAGGGAAGLGGFFAGAASGAIASTYATGIESMGNAIAFGDPLPSPAQFLEGVGFGALTGGVFNGLSALANGRTFWNGRLPVSRFQLPELGGGVGFQTGHSDNVNVPQNVTSAPQGLNTTTDEGYFANPNGGSEPTLNVNIESGAGNSIDRSSSVLGHIFRNDLGHVNPATTTTQSRYLQLFEEVANNPANLRIDAVSAGLVQQQAVNAGVQVYTQTFRAGQVWVFVRNGRIFDAGVNLIPR